MEEGVSNLWTMRNDFHPRAAAFTSRGSSRSRFIRRPRSQDRLRGGKKGEKVGRKRSFRCEELEKIGGYYYDEGLLLLEESAAFCKCCKHVKVIWLNSVCEKCIILFSEKWISFFIQVMAVVFVKICSSCGSIAQKFNIKI